MQGIDVYVKVNDWSGCHEEIRFCKKNYQVHSESPHELHVEILAWTGE